MRASKSTHLIECAIVLCHEDDPFVLVSCRDGAIYCAHHALLMGYCWDCGDGDPSTIADGITDGMCHDCRAAYIGVRL